MSVAGAAAPRPVPHVGLEPVDPVRDAELVHRWMHEPHVRPWWDLAVPVLEVRAYLERLGTNGLLRPWIARLDGRPFGYVETYRVEDDELARHYPAQPGDRGWHVLVGPPELLGTGAARSLGRTVLARLFAEPGVERVVCEPAATNERMIRYCRALGHDQRGLIDLPDKVAALLVCPVEAFDERFPGDRTAARPLPTETR